MTLFPQCLYYIKKFVFFQNICFTLIGHLPSLMKKKKNRSILARALRLYKDTRSSLNKRNYFTFSHFSSYTRIKWGQNILCVTVWLSTSGISFLNQYLMNSDSILSKAGFCEKTAFLLNNKSLLPFHFFFKSTYIFEMELTIVILRHHKTICP